jgi:hypothetical protein
VSVLALAAFSVGTAVALALWVHGVYCYIQMVRHRRPGVSPLEVAWSADRLTPLGLEYRRRALRSYAAFVILAVLLMIAGSLLAAAWREQAAERPDDAAGVSSPGAKSYYLPIPRPHTVGICSLMGGTAPGS